LRVGAVVDGRKNRGQQLLIGWSALPVWWEKKAAAAESIERGKINSDCRRF
jgi:hypothetical protein